MKRRTAFSTTVFMKRMMAISGLVFLFFVLFHAYGNLHYFEGEVAYDHYAVFLRALLVPIMPYGGVLWILPSAVEDAGDFTYLSDTLMTKRWP